MLGHPAHIRLFVALMLTSVTLSASSAFAQSQATRPDSRQNDVAAEDPPRNYLKSEVDTLKAENAVVRELLRKMEEQQKVLQEQVDRLQRRLDGVTTAVVQPSGQSQVADAGEPPASGTNASVPATSAGNASAQQASVEKPDKEDHYQDGIIIWQTPKTLRSLSC
jgi:cell division protein FtsB